MALLNRILALGLLALVLWRLLDAALRRDGASLQPPGEEPPLSRPWRIALWALALGLGLLRLWRFGSVPGGMNQDEAMAAVDALALARHGTDRFGTWLPAHFTAWGYGQMSVLMSYCMVPFFRLFGMSAVTARLPLLLWSFAGMGAAFCVLDRLCSRRAAWAGLLFLCLCPWHFMQSRWALDCNLLPHLFLIGFALLRRGAARPAALYGSMAFFGLSMYCYGLAFLAVPLFLLPACLLLLAQRRVRPGQVLLCALVYFGVSWPIYGTMLINAMGWPTVELPFVTMPYFPQSIRSQDLIFFSPRPLEQLKSNLWFLWYVGFAQNPDLPWNAIDGFGAVYRCSWPLWLLGLGLSVFRAFRGRSRRVRRDAALLLLFWLCALLTGLCTNGLNMNRLNTLFYPHVLFLALGAECLIRRARALVWPLLASLLLLGGCFVQNYFGPWAEQVSPYFFEDFLAALGDAGAGDFDRYVVTPDSQYTGTADVSEILTLYALQVDAAYYQGVSGEEPPYALRFVYRRFSDADLMAPTPGTVWVQRRLALPPELPPGWVLKEFGEYATLYYGGQDGSF